MFLELARQFLGNSSRVMVISFCHWCLCAAHEHCCFINQARWLWLWIWRLILLHDWVVDPVVPGFVGLHVVIIQHLMPG